MHLTLNPVIDSGPPGRARARSVLLIVDPGPPPALTAAPRIIQELRQEDGRWKISRRTVSASDVTSELPGYQRQQEES